MLYVCRCHILVPEFGTSKLAESNARVAFKICIDKPCSQLVTDRRNPLPRNSGTVHILIFMSLRTCICADGFSVEKMDSIKRLSAEQVGEGSGIAPDDQSQS